LKKINTNQFGIVLMALATGLIHLVVLNIKMGNLDLLFTLNGLGYLGLILIYLVPLPIPFLKTQHKLVRWAFIGFTVLTFLAWLVKGERSTLGYLTQVIQVALIALLTLDKNGSS